MATLIYLSSFYIILLTQWSVYAQEGLIYRDREHNAAVGLLKRPEFLSSPQKFSVMEGSDVSFPCAIDKEVDAYKMIFKYVSSKGEDRIIYAGLTKVADFPRIRKQGSSFILNQVQKTDVGSYVCRFETKPLTRLVHKLDILYPPVVRTVSPKMQKASQGTTVHLQCSTEGNPTPTITWRKIGGYLPSGAQSEEGYKLTLSKIGRSAKGTYICEAHNGIGQAVNETMEIDVEYPPEIISEEAIIHGGEGANAKLVCVVHGSPTPDIIWLKGGSLVSSDKHKAVHEKGTHRYSLTIYEVSEQNFGKYTCRASNALGSVESTLHLTGLAKTPTFNSSPAMGTERNTFILVFHTESSAPIIQYHLKYREVMKNRGTVSWKDSLNFPNNNIYLLRKGAYKVKHKISGLRAATNYEAIVQVENKFGWSKESKLFKFHTRKFEPTTTTTVSSFPQIRYNHGPLVEEVADGQALSTARYTFQPLFLICLSILISALM